MNPLLLGPIADIVKTVVGRVWPDPEKQAQAELEVAKLAQTGELQKLQTQMSAILAEAQSADPWTSRARPSFLYVMYVMILASIPMGVLHAFYPVLSVSIAEGMKGWLAAIPGELYALFGVGYSGYAIMRGIEKTKGTK